MTPFFVPHVQTIVVLLQLEIYKVCVFRGVEEDCCCRSVLNGMEGEEVGWGKGGE